MFTFYRYIFGTLYFFCINTFKEKEFPWAFASGVISFLWMINLITLVGLYEYTILSDKVGAFEKYDNWIGLALIFTAWIYVRHDYRYKRILEYYEKISAKKKKVLGILSILYVIASFVALFFVAHLNGKI